MTLNEAKTRVLHIDPQLRAADWKLDDRTQVRLEVPVDGYDAEPWNGVTDYCHYHASGNVLAVVEAKRATRSPREADEQLRHYVTEIAKKQAFAPFGFMANGHDIWFWEIGLANPRLVAGFFTPADLERLHFLRQNRLPLEATAINSAIVEAVNLVFMKPVQSRIKLWQMIGRGTRNNQACQFHDRLPEGKKTEFKIIDFWQNDFNKKADDKPPTDMPVSCRSSTRDSRSSNAIFLITPPRRFVRPSPTCARCWPAFRRDSFPVKKVWLQVGQAWEDDFWTLHHPGEAGLPPPPRGAPARDSPRMSMWLLKPSPTRWSD